MLDFEENIIGKPIAIIGNAIADIFTLKPSNEISQAVIVVPIFAPMITPIDSTKLSKPAFTKLTIITVVAEDDCKSAVIKNPVVIPKNLLEVMDFKMPLNLLPAAF